MEPPVVLTFRGQTYRRYPGSPHPTDRDYYRATAVPRRYLHRVIYEAHNGPIPDGHRVIHRDGNPFNNAPVNLVALPHQAPSPRRTRAQMLASVQANLLDPEGHPVVCEQCQTTFTSYRKLPARFCSGKCRTAAWRTRTRLH